LYYKEQGCFVDSECESGYKGKEKKKIKIFVLFLLLLNKNGF
jgi:hypothetical protein